jgi:hypothetical protein
VGTEKSGGQMFNGVQRRLIHYRFFVGLLKPEIKGGQNHPAKTILPGNIYPRFQPEMVNLKTGNFFHGYIAPNFF